MVLLVLSLALSAVACKKDKKEEDQPEVNYVEPFMVNKFGPGLEKLIGNLTQGEAFTKIHAEATIGVRLALFDNIEMDYELAFKASIQPDTATTKSQISIELNHADKGAIVVGIYLDKDKVYVRDRLTQAGQTQTYMLDTSRFGVSQYLDDVTDVLYSTLASKEKENADGVLVDLSTPLSANNIKWVTAVERNTDGTAKLTDGKRVPVVGFKATIDGLGLPGIIGMVGPILSGLATFEGAAPNADDEFADGDYKVNIDMAKVGEMIPTLLGMFAPKTEKGAKPAEGGLDIGGLLNDLAPFIDAVLPLLLGDGVTSDVLAGLLAGEGKPGYDEAMAAFKANKFPAIGISASFEDDALSGIGLDFNKTGENAIGLRLGLNSLKVKFNEAPNIIPEAVITEAGNKQNGAVKVGLDLGIGTEDGYAIKADLYLNPGDFSIANASANIYFTKDGEKMGNLKGGLYVDKTVAATEENYPTYLIFDMEGVYDIVGMTTTTKPAGETVYKYRVYLDGIFDIKNPDYVKPVTPPAAVAELFSMNGPSNADATTNPTFDMLNKIGGVVGSILDIFRNLKTEDPNNMTISADINAKDIIGIIEKLDIKAIPNTSFDDTKPESADNQKALAINAKNLSAMLVRELCKAANSIRVDDETAIKYINKVGKFEFAITDTLQDLLFGNGTDKKGLSVKIKAGPATGNTGAYSFGIELLNGTTKLAHINLTLDLVEANAGDNTAVAFTEEEFKAAQDLNNKEIEAQIGAQFQAVLDFLIDPNV